MADDNTRGAKQAKAKKTVHWHGCTNCTDAYEDTCQDPKIDHRCNTCRGALGWRLLEDNRKPRDCCRERARLARKEEIKTYRLAGSKIWFICPVCARTQTFDPKHRQPTRPILPENRSTWSFLTQTRIPSSNDAMPAQTSENP